MHKFSRITEFLYLGGRDAARDLDTMTSLKISFVLNMTPTRSTDPKAGVPNYFVGQKKITYVVVVTRAFEGSLAHLYVPFLADTNDAPFLITQEKIFCSI